MTLRIGNPTPGTLAATDPSLSGMPEEIIHELIRFNPDSVRALRAVSRALRLNTEDFLQQNTEEIAAWCSSAYSPLGALLRRELVVIRSRLESQPDRIHIQFHMSLPRTIRSMGVALAECPTRILLAREISRFTGRIKDVNLQRAWGPIRQGTIGLDLPPPGIPARNASAQEIRSWMSAGANQPLLLQRNTRVRLTQLHLTCVPEEIGLFTRLQCLHLHNNQLVSLPEGIFRGLNALQQLDLNGNQLGSLPEGIFQGLATLQTLFLAYNQLSSLPEGIFQGLNALTSLTLNNNQLVSLPEGIFRGLNVMKWLYLDNNQLVSLPEGIFRGLNVMKWLHLENNQLVSLPEGIFQGLNVMKWLYLDNNQLVSLPEGIFQGLNVMKWLYLDNNQLVSLPEGIFQGLNAMRKLTLYGNPQLLVFYNGLPAGNNISCRGTIDEFFHYPCTSHFAELYQLAAGDGPLDAVQASFSRLPVAIKNPLYGKVWVEAGGPIGDQEWGEHHTFEDMPRFQRALKRYVTESFDGLTEEQKNGVYGRVYHLAQEQGAQIDPNVHNWGEVHAFDNILRLIDAMMRQQEQDS